jgi:hypothetical protein
MEKMQQDNQAVNLSTKQQNPCRNKYKGFYIYDAATAAFCSLNALIVSAIALDLPKSPYPTSIAPVSQVQRGR